VFLGPLTDRYKVGLYSRSILLFYIVINVKLCVVRRRINGSILLFFLKWKTEESWLDSSAFLTVEEGGVMARFICFP
jgi:hypothetical protein